jgi:hypothetical protein
MSWGLGGLEDVSRTCKGHVQDISNKVPSHNHNNPISIILIGKQLVLSKPSIIIIWTYQDMMEWMSRILDGEMASADDEDFGSSWANVVELCPKPQPQ